MSDCSSHRVPATGRCYTCHKPFCGRCNSINGCCSAQCAEGKKRFSGLGNKPRASPLLPKLIKGAVLIALIMLALRYKRQILEFF